MKNILHNKNFNTLKGILILCLFSFIVLTPAFAGGNKEEKDEASSTITESSPRTILIYISGVLDGSPTYQAMADGAEKFVASHPSITLKIYEAGFNQAEWEPQLTSLVASGKYDIVLTTNPSMPEICDNVSKKFPKQKFIVTDGSLAGNPNITTFEYDQYQQAKMLGYLAGLVTTSSMTGANSDKKIGFLVSQDYPLLTNSILPGYLDGAQMVDSAITMDKRTVGNWYDASKAAELTTAMIESGVDVMNLDIGSAAPGAIKSSVTKGTYITYSNIDNYAAAPGTIIGCGIVKQKALTKEILQEVISSTVQWGTATKLGVKEGYIDFVDDSTYYGEGLTESVKTQFNAFLSDVRSGKIDLTQ